MIVIGIALDGDARLPSRGAFGNGVVNDEGASRTFATPSTLGRMSRSSPLQPSHDSTMRFPSAGIDSICIFFYVFSIPLFRSFPGSRARVVAASIGRSSASRSEAPALRVDWFRRGAPEFHNWYFCTSLTVHDSTRVGENTHEISQRWFLRLQNPNSISRLVPHPLLYRVVNRQTRAEIPIGEFKNMSHFLGIVCAERRPRAS